MCVTLGSAKLSKTRIYAGTATRNGEAVTVLSYQNTAQHLGGISDGRFRGGTSPAAGNAMILAFPTVELMGPANVIDTKDLSFLEDMERSVVPVMRAKAGPADLLGTRMSREPQVQVYDHGIYTTVTGHDPEELHAALVRVPPHKRPDLSAEMLEFYAIKYPGWQLMLECFANRKAIQADPLLYWYKSGLKQSLFVPTLDSHTGGVPDVSAMVEMDHVIMVGTAADKGEPVRYKKPMPRDVIELLPSHAMGERFVEKSRNGDYTFQFSDIANGDFNPTFVAAGAMPPVTLHI